MASKVSLGEQKYALALIDELLTNERRRFAMRGNTDWIPNRHNFSMVILYDQKVFTAWCGDSQDFIICVEMKFFSDLKNNRPVVNQNKIKRNTFAKKG